MAEQKGITQDPKYDSYDFPTYSPIDLPGHPGHTTPEQDAAVQQLRMMLEQDGHTERLDTLTLVPPSENTRNTPMCKCKAVC